MWSFYVFFKPVFSPTGKAITHRPKYSWSHFFCLLLGKPLNLKTSILSLSQFRSPSTSPWPTHDMGDYDQVSVVRAQGDAQAQSVTRGVVAGQGRGRGCGPGPWASLGGRALLLASRPSGDRRKEPTWGPGTLSRRRLKVSIIWIFERFA